MGEHNDVSSLQTICCSSGEWYHKRCLKEQACQLRDDFKCPKCADVEAFRENMLFNGIFIPNNNAMQLYRSFNAGDNDAIALEPLAKKRRVRKDWIYNKTFNTKAEADRFIQDGNWGYMYDNDSDDGKSITYRCNLVKFRGGQCAASVRLIFDSKSNKIQLFIADNEHTHEQHPNAIETIPIEVQEAIKMLFENNVTKPKAMKVNLLKKGFDLPPPAKLTTFMNKLKQKNGINFGTLEKWLQDNSPLPEDEVKPFVLGYEMDDDDPSKIDFRYFVTSRKLLRLAVESEQIHVDATYKITWEGFPLLVIGITDLHRAFHPIGAAVCYSETSKDFEFIFTAVKQGLINIFDIEFKPKYVISDAAIAIHNAAKKVFGPDIEIIMCWFHMRRAVADKLPTYIKDITKQSQFLSDLDHLQVAKTREIFHIALDLFMKKWRLESEEMIDYFEKQWVQICPNWYEAFAKRIPSSNNGLESRNRLIKDEHTFRERMELGVFNTTLLSMIETWSISITPGLSEVNSDAPELPLNKWTEGYQFAKSNSKITSRRSANKVIYRSATSQTVVDSIEWENFDAFKKQSFAFHDTIFEYPPSRNNWLRSECDCRDFFKLFTCAHIIGIAIRLKCVVPPVEAKNIPIGEKRKRGRPAKAKSALIRQ